MNPFIVTDGLTYKYEDAELNESPVLSDLSVEIKSGEFVAVLGHNGSGKSTFAKLLNMILVASSGKIYINGRDITDVNMTDDDVLALRKNVGMVFQNPDNQLVATVVEDVGMLEYAHHEPHRLSGGQKQRVAIAGIIAMRPDCIIFDESTAMLDPMGRKEVMNSILRLNREKNITVIMITHYMEEAAMADRIIVLDDGNKLIDGTPAEVFEHEDELRKCGLNVPQCTELIHKLRAEGLVGDGECVTPEQCADIIMAALEKENGNG